VKQFAARTVYRIAYTVRGAPVTTKAAPRIHARQISPVGMSPMTNKAAQIGQPPEDEHTVHTSTGRCSNSHKTGIRRATTSGLENNYMDPFAPTHLLLLLLVILIMFGPSKLGDVGGALGKGIRDLKGAINEPESIPASMARGQSTKPRSMQSGRGSMIVRVSLGLFPCPICKGQSRAGADVGRQCPGNPAPLRHAKLSGARGAMCRPITFRRHSNWQMLSATPSGERRTLYADHRAHPECGAVR
jgi:sec-independent protein translocase protein TatA